MLQGSICKFRDFDSEWYRQWSTRLGQPGVIHRKLWEWCAQSQILFERDMLRAGRKGIGFAVGREPLASLFASLGASVDATDIFVGDTAEIWASTGQHAAGKDSLYHAPLLERATFDERVRFFPADMNDFAELPSESYDFLWSSCAMEHLGGLELGLKFVRDSMRLLKPGGIACHTTEFNVSHLTNTVETGISVIYRESDLRQLDCDLRAQFCCLEEMDFRPGCDREDVLYDLPPWQTRGHLHIKLLIEGFVSTSAVLICRKYA